MLNRSVLLLFAMLIMILVACSGEDENIDYYQTAYTQYNEEKYEEAIKNFRKVVEKNQQTEESKKALFMLGFINANHTNDLDQAKKYYQQFLQQYPDHELAASAKYELDNLGKDINELSIFKETEQKETKAAQ